MNYDAEYRREDAAGGIGVSRTALRIRAALSRALVSLTRGDAGRATPLLGFAKCWQWYRASENLRSICHDVLGLNYLIGMY